MHPRALTLLGLLIVVPFLGAAENPAVVSPSVPATTPAATAPAPDKSGRWELVGILGTREAPMVRIKDLEENTAEWLHLGDLFGPLKIKLIAADVDAGTVTIQTGNERTVLGLRVNGVAAGEATSATTTASTSSAPTPAATPAPLPSTGDAAADAKRDQDIAEREARMLVSDLLEISVIQRKAYEDKQAEAAKTAAATAP